MAESRHKIKAIGSPFDIQYSSCSNIKPSKFDWTIENEECVVHIDNGLLVQPDHNIPKNKRFGWVCESRYIIPNVYNFLINNHKILFHNFYTTIFTCDHALLDSHVNFKYCPNGSNYPWINKQDWKIYNKTKICSMFASPKKYTEGHVYRHDIAKLALDLGFDVFGGAHGTKRTVLDPMNPWSTKLNGVQDYMFSIIIENGLYDTYYTEKITDCFATGTIPVYWGTKKILNQFDGDGIVWLEPNKEIEILKSLSSELYISKTKAIKNNFDIVNTLKIADDYLYDGIQNEIFNSIK